MRSHEDAAQRPPPTPVRGAAEGPGARLLEGAGVPVDLVAVSADLRNDPGHSHEDADVDLRGREDEPRPPPAPAGPRGRDTWWPLRRRGSVGRVLEPWPAGPEAALGRVCASAPRRLRAPERSPERTSRAAACVLWTRAPHRREEAMVPEAHAARHRGPGTLPGSHRPPLPDLGTRGGHGRGDFPFCPVSPPCWGPAPTGVCAAGCGARRSWQRRAHPPSCGSSRGPEGGWLRAGGSGGGGP